MITRAIIKDIDYQTNKCRVRLPLFESTNKREQIATATFAVTPGMCNSYKKDDVVYVAFNEGKAAQPVVIGKLYVDSHNEINNTSGNLSLSSLNVSDTATLPVNTKLTVSTATADNIVDKAVTKFSSIADIITAINNIYASKNIQEIPSDIANPQKVTGTFYCQTADKNVFNKQISGYTAKAISEAGGKSYYRIEYNGEKTLSPEQVKTYMQYMMGQYILPEDHEELNYGIIFIIDGQAYYPSYEQYSNGNWYLFIRPAA